MLEPSACSLHLPATTQPSQLGWRGSEAVSSNLPPARPPWTQGVSKPPNVGGGPGLLLL